jgi:hypothetical protein
MNNFTITVHLESVLIDSLVIPKGSISATDSRDLAEELRNLLFRSRDLAPCTGTYRDANGEG